MYDILKAICEDEENQFEFMYARKDFQNLFDGNEVEGQIYVFLDPVESDDNENDTNIVESITYSGDFMVVASSKLDLDYQERYDQHIKPIIEGALKTIKSDIRCGNEVKFHQWRKVEIINALDYNFDGIIVQYNIEVTV